MMEPFPEDWELLYLFETEPRVLDPDIPWAYNHLTFELTRDSDRIVCVIEPGNEQLDFTWWHDKTRHLALQLRWVSGLTVIMEGGREYMIVAFRDQHLTELRIQLRPTIECEWGTNNSFPR